MKAFLTTTKIQLPFESYADILKSDFDVMTFKSSANEDYFKNAPSGSILRKIYEDKIAHYPGVWQLGIEESVRRILKKEVIYSADLGSIFLYSKNLCDLMDIKQLR